MNKKTGKIIKKMGLGKKASIPPNRIENIIASNVILFAVTPLQYNFITIGLSKF
jgi:hypothetical protein